MIELDVNSNRYNINLNFQNSLDNGNSWQQISAEDELLLGLW